MILCLMIILGMVFLFWLGASVRLPRGCSSPKGQLIFYRTAYYLLRQSQKIAGIRKKKETVKPFEVERLAGVLMVLFLGTGLSLLFQAATMGGSILIDGYMISRPAQGEGERSQELNVQIGGEEQTEQVEVVVAERRYTKEEKRQFLEQALKELETEILGENSSADEVRGRVVLPDTLVDGRVRVSWSQDPPDLLDTDGYITDDLPEEGALLQLKAVLLCDDQEEIYECALQLLPQQYSREEQLRRDLQKEVDKADEQSAQEEHLRLPKEVDGQSLTWREPESSVISICMLLTVLAAVVAWIGKNQELQKKEEQRKRQMALDYPDLLFKMSMLLNAGMTMQSAFFKIALEYRNRRDSKVRYAYEEMLKSYYEMKSGVPEARAYENFGRRCGGNSYVKLGTMLSSNLQKGSEGLAAILQEEAQLSMEERRQMAKKFGEEAGTKLLLPMVLMLVVVLVILMVPAMLAF